MYAMNHFKIIVRIIARRESKISEKFRLYNKVWIAYLSRIKLETKEPHTRMGRLTDYEWVERSLKKDKSDRQGSGSAVWILGQ